MLNKGHTVAKIDVVSVELSRRKETLKAIDLAGMEFVFGLPEMLKTVGLVGLQSLMNSLLQNAEAFCFQRQIFLLPWCIPNRML